MSENSQEVELTTSIESEPKHEQIEQEPTAQIVPPTEPVRMKRPHTGGRKKDPTKETFGTERTTCPNCGKSLSKHALKWTHKCPAKKMARIIEETVPVQTAPVVTEDTQNIINKIEEHERKVNPPMPEPITIARRMLDLDQEIRHDDPNVHRAVNSYIRNLKQRAQTEKRDKYRSMLSGMFG